MNSKTMLLAVTAVLLMIVVNGSVLAQDCCPSKKNQAESSGYTDTGLMQTDAAPASDAPAAKAKMVDGNTWTVAEDGHVHFTCPVCDMIHEMHEAKASAVIAGKKYYLCNPDEQAKLRAGASTYLGERFFVPGNLQTWSQTGATFKDPVSGEVAELNNETPSLQVEHVRYFFVSKETKAEFAARQSADDE